MQSESTFSYSTQPHAAPFKRKTKYRDDSDLPDPALSNLMHDPRVVRGSTYSTKILSLSLKTELQPTKKISRADAHRAKFATKRSSTPPALAGRSHIDMQTEDFLEELTDRPIDVDAETQTQAFMDRPASPLFVPARTGQDVITQILPGDLWDFDLEVDPILEVLVGKTLHVAMLELMQEEELEAIYRQQEEFELVRQIEFAEVQRLQAEAKRKALEKERRLEQELVRAADRQELEEKVAAQFFTQQYLGSLHSGVFDVLEGEGHFYDPLQKEIEEITMVDLLAGLQERSDLYEAAQEIANELILAATSKAKEYEEIFAILQNIANEKREKELIIEAAEKKEALRTASIRLAEAAAIAASNAEAEQDDE
jgi:radial spoke head protein 3